MSAGWPRAPCAPPGPSRGQDRGEQRSWGAAVPGLGGCCAWDPVAEDGAAVVPLGVWDAARSPAPALLRIQMNHSAQALPGGPGQAGGSVGAAPPQLHHCRPREEQGVLNQGMGDIERCRLHLKVHTSQRSGEATLHLWVFSSHWILPALHLSHTHFLQAPSGAISPGELEAQWPPSRRQPPSGSGQALLLLPPQPSPLHGPLPHVAHYNSSCSGLDLKSLPY